MADKQRGFIADNIRVTPKRYGTGQDGAIKDLGELGLHQKGGKDRIKANAEIIEGAISEAFDWSSTEEGYDYWYSVCMRLNRIKKQGR